MSEKSTVNFDIRPITLAASGLTTLKVGGVLKNVYVPADALEFAEVINALESRGEIPFILGGGSNVVVADGEIRSPVVYTKNLNKIRFANGFCFCECGAKLSEISRRAREYDLGGLEFLAGVPLTVGGAVKMNAGAFSHQIFDFVKAVFVLSRACDMCERVHICELSLDEINVGYRKGADGVIVGAVFKLEHISKNASLNLAKEYVLKRRGKQPKEHSAGSVFKNGEIPAGKLIEECGLKGTRIGGAQISELHANFIVNTGGATATDFLELVELCEREVENKFKIKLEREFKLIQ